MTTQEREGDHGHVTIDLGDRPFVRVVIPRTGNAEADAGETRTAIRALLAALDVEPEDVAAFKTRLRDSVLGKNVPAPAAPPARSGGGGGNRGRGGARRDEGTALPESCNNCNAKTVYLMAAYRNPKTGKDVSARVVCRQCKDGQYDHLVRWVNEDEEPDDIPF